jgi:hypothetical protein
MRFNAARFACYDRDQMPAGFEVEQRARGRDALDKAFGLGRQRNFSELRAMLCAGGNVVGDELLDAALDHFCRARGSFLEVVIELQGNGVFAVRRCGWRRFRLRRRRRRRLALILARASLPRHENRRQNRKSRNSKHPENILAQRAALLRE